MKKRPAKRRVSKPKHHFKPKGQSNYLVSSSVFDWPRVAIDTSKVAQKFPELLFEFAEYVSEDRLLRVLQTFEHTTQTMIQASLKAVYSLRNHHNQMIYKPHEAQTIINVTELYSTLHSGKVTQATQVLIEAAISVVRGLRFEGQPVIYRETGSRLNLELYRDYCASGMISPAMHKSFEVESVSKSGSLRRKKK